jgi:phosphoribosylglycinamide formyltransferase 1
VSPNQESVNLTIQPLAIAVLISGGGTTLKNLLDVWNADALPVDFRLVISSRASAGGLEYADRVGIPTISLGRRQFSDAESHSRAVFDAVRRAGVDLVVMGGYLEHLLIPEDFENRVINIHPSLIPAFCGKGMYGLRVHAAALEFGVKITGCTVHYVDNQYDHGPILLQRACLVRDDDTPESLQKRVFELECEALPDAIRQIAASRFSS